MGIFQVCHRAGFIFKAYSITSFILDRSRNFK